MRIRIILFILLISRFNSLAQINDQCANPIKLTNLNNYCSPASAFSNNGATADGFSAAGCWSGAGTINDVWFSFVATAYDVNISVNGNINGLGTLSRPQIALYSGTCSGTISELACKSATTSNTVSLYKGGLIIGVTYLIRVDGLNSNTGTFNLCINNFTPPTNISGDCTGAAILCNKNTVTVPQVSGPGNDPNEGYGTCLDLGFGNVESNSTWFQWTAKTSGTFDFHITPLTPGDDIDFVLYRLSPNCSNKSMLRCNASSCLGPGNLGVTGLDVTGVNAVENANCGGPGNGNSPYSTTINLTAGFTYVLLINNFTAANNGFTLSFGGTATFLGPDASYTYSAASSCVTTGTPITFVNTSTGATVNNWTFGPNASTPTYNGVAPPPITYNTPGTYTATLEVQSAQGCKVVYSKDIVVNALPTASIVPQSICSGQSVTLTTNPALPAGNYSWSPTQGLNNPAISNPVASPTTTTNYTLVVTDANGCTGSGSGLVTVNPLPVISVSPGVGICSGMSSQITSSGGTTYLWTPSTGLNDPNIANPTATPAATTTYSLTVTDASGCTSTASTTITVNPFIILSTSPDTGICTGSQAQLNVTGPNATTYSWTPALGLSNTTIANPVANPAATTTYSVTVNNSFGCSGSATVTVTVNSLPVVTVSPSAGICLGSSAQLSAGGGVIYSWMPSTGLSNPNSDTTTANPLQTTTYTVNVTDVMGCQNTNTVTVNVTPLPVISVSPAAAICPGGSTQLTAGGAINYVWTPSNSLINPNTSTPTASPSVNTTYTVVATDANGCIGSNTITVSVNPLPTVTVSTPAAVCLGFGMTITAGGGTGYVWTPAGTLNSDIVSNPIATPTVTTTYTVTVTDANGCVNTGSTTVNVNPLPVVAVSANQAVCVGYGTTISAGGGTTYVWTPAGTLSSPNVSNPIATPPVTTTYTVTATDINGCVNTNSTTVTVNSPPNVVASPSVAVCVGTPVVISAGGGTTYSWSPAGTLTSPSSDTTTANPASTTTYTVTVTDANSCVSTGTTTVSINLFLTVNVSQNTALCQGASTQLTSNGIGGNVYSWTPTTGLDNPNIANPVATPAVTTTYTVNVSNGSGCNGSNQVTVVVNPPPPVITSPPTGICLGSSTIISVGGGTSYAWTPTGSLSNPTVFNPTATPVVTTIYTVTVTDVNGCVSTGSTTVNVNNIVPTVSPNTSVCLGSQAQLSASGGITYLWTPAAGLNNPNSPTPIATPAVTTTYNVSVTDANGCQANKSVTVSVLPSPIANAGPDQEICEGESVQLNACCGLSYNWQPSPSLNNLTIPDPVATPLFTSSYVVSVSNASNCPPAKDTITVVVHPIPLVYAGPDTTVMAGTSIGLNVTGNGTNYQWTPSTWLSCSDCASPMATPFETTTYLINTVDAYGCRNMDTMTVYVEDILTLYVPTAFSPNNYDANNNLFYAQGVGIYSFEFYVFDRWGTLLFETHDRNVGWDGSYNGNLVQQDVYVWLAKAMSITGKSLSKTGSVTVVR